ncbi:MAG: hypothetical protein WC763_02265 [Candidatus Paceibacterota bacterium]|jgi:hypothetical protein
MAKFTHSMQKLLSSPISKKQLLLAGLGVIISASIISSGLWAPVPDEESILGPQIGAAASL